MPTAADCDRWRDPSLLARHPLLILLRGAHIMEYRSELQPRASFHAQRADALAAALAPHLKARRDAAVIYLRAHWGALHATRREVAPLSKPEAPRDMWHWDLIPTISDADEAGLRSALPPAPNGGGGGLVVIDPTAALARRQDCRDNHLHLAPSVYLASTWRMLQGALVAAASAVR